MSRPRLILAGVVIAAVALVANGTDVSAATRPAAAPTAAAANSEASLVADEDARIIDIRTVTAAARAQHSTLIASPYRLLTGSSYTLVLTARALPYTVDDLLQLAPQTFVPQTDGSYLLSENLYVDEGATLALTSTSAPLRIKLQSSPSGFVSIVSFGGRLAFEGTASAPVSISSFDPSTGAPDQVVADGRAYIRGIGGTVTLNHFQASYLGFWSGRTGGFAITGDDRPDLGTLGPSTAAAQTYGKNHHESKFARKQAAIAAANSKIATTTLAGNGAIQPAGALNAKEQATAIGSDFQYAEGSVTSSSFDDNAFGLFLTGAKNFVVTDSSFTANLYSGLVVHRYVISALLQVDTSTANGDDGFDVTRAANDVDMLQDTADDNAAIGFSVNGNPLATTESAAGMPLTAYGNHVIADSTATGNGTVGIEVNGAFNTIIESSIVTHSPMGIVVLGTAVHPRIVSNRIDHIAKHGISIRDGVTGAVVQSNTIDHAGTGIYVRNSAAVISHNTIDGGDKHAISLVGHVGDTAVTYNVMKGRGDGAIDTYRVRSSSVTSASNNTSGWVDLRIWTRHLKELEKPLTLLWMSVLLLIAVTAIRGRRRRPAGALPYANSRSLPAHAGSPVPSRGPRVVPTRTTSPAPAAFHPGQAGPPSRRLWLPGSADGPAPAPNPAGHLAAEGA